MSISNVGKLLVKQARFLVAIALAAVIGGVTTAGVLAAIPDADGTTHACYSNGVLGRVKIIDSTSQACSNNETAISWKQNGSPLLANPAGKNLSETVMVYWDLRNMDFTGTNFTGAKLVSSDLRGANLTNTDFTNALLMNANLSNQNLSNTNLQGAILTGTNVANTSFTNVSIGGATLNGQDLSGYDLSGILHFAGVEFYNGNLNGATLSTNPVFRDGRFGNTQFTNLDLSNADFSGTYLLDADFTGSNLANVMWSDPSGGSQTVCPDGTGVNHGDTCIGHL